MDKIKSLPTFFSLNILFLLEMLQIKYNALRMSFNIDCNAIAVKEK